MRRVAPRVLADHRRAHAVTDQHDLVGLGFRTPLRPRARTGPSRTCRPSASALWPWPGRSSVITRYFRERRHLRRSTTRNRRSSRGRTHRRLPAAVRDEWIARPSTDAACSAVSGHISNSVTNRRRMIPPGSMACSRSLRPGSSARNQGAFVLALRPRAAFDAAPHREPQQPRREALDRDQDLAVKRDHDLGGGDRPPRPSFWPPRPSASSATTAMGPSRTGGERRGCRLAGSR